jgi:salicylate hydroxylase
MSNRKLHITIIGGGIGGLTAAIALRRAGHSITVYEQSSLSHEVGQGITIAPNAGRILQRLGLDFNKARMVDFLGSDYVDATSLEHLKPVNDQQDFGQRFGLMMKTAYRIDLHAALLELARGSEGAGEPVRIVTAARVDRVNAEDGKVTFASGDTVIADLVVAVDGVKSSAAQSINGAETPVLDSTGTIVYRFTLSQEAILEEGTTNRLIDGEPRMSSFYVSAAKDRWVVRYCCRDDGLQNFALYVLRTHEEADRQEHALKYKTNRASLLEEMKGFHPALLKLAEMSTDVLPMWRCTTREPLSKLHRGRLVVLGDAAHPVT